jgi:hypothetical protein
MIGISRLRVKPPEVGIVAQFDVRVALSGRRKTPRCGEPITPEVSGG